MCLVVWSAVAPWGVMQSRESELNTYPVAKLDMGDYARAAFTIELDLGCVPGARTRNGVESVSSQPRAHRVRKGGVEPPRPKRTLGPQSKQAPLGHGVDPAMAGIQPDRRGHQRPGPDTSGDPYR